jgi:hypothetical protein
MPYTSRSSPGKNGLPLVLAFVFAGSALAQSLNWEGQTGIFVTPFAYTAASPKNSLGRPVVAYHFLDAGPVLGNFHTASVTAGLLGRAEFGYTRAFHQAGDTATLSPLWDSGFNVVHAKVNIVAENAAKQKWLPAISGGFVVREPVHNVSGVLGARNYTSADFYLVATKTVTQIRKLPLVLNLGYKATNASIYSLAGVAPAYSGRLFGAAAFVLRGPAKSTLILASEFSQQPREIRNLPGASIPTTLTYALRIVPREHSKFNVDLGVAQAAGKILPAVDVQVRHQFALGVSYAF